MNNVALRLWLWFWHLLPANPILVRVVHGASRRPRHLYLRLAYLSALLIVVIVSLAFPFGGEDSSLTDLAKGASQTFKGAAIVQLALMCFLAPIFTAGAISQERNAQTFNILLSTPLTDAQIVFGSLLSRLYFVMLLLLAGLPIFLITMVYGGVTTPQIVESFAIAGSTAILTGSLAIVLAMMAVGTKRTVFSFYMVIALYLLSLFFLGQWQRTWVEVSPPNVAGVKMSWLTPLHPFLALDVALNRVHAPPSDQLSEYSAISRFALAHPSTAYIIWTTSSAALLTLFSVLFVRRSSKIGESTLWTSLVSRFTRRTVGERTRPPRHVWANPVAWREARARAGGGALLYWAIILGGLVASGLLLIYYLTDQLPVATVRSWLASMIMIQFTLALLIATNTAATSMTKEKESMTMDLLLTTPLTSKYILWGKLRGLVSFAAPLLVGPSVVLLVFGLTGPGTQGSSHAVWWEVALEIGVLMVIFTAAACVLALHVSLNARTTVSAVMYSVGLLIVSCGALSGINFAIVGAAGGEFGAFFAAFTPFTSIWYLVDPSSLFDSPTEFAQGAASVRTASIIGCAIAAGVYSFIIYSAYSGLVRGFDMTMRKQTGT